MGERRVSTGLCGECIHAKVTPAAGGSEFLRCLLALADRRFVKYPRLPVFSCVGFQPAPESVRDTP